MRLPTVIGFAICLCIAPIQAQTHLLVVTGLGGDEAHSERFHGWAASMIDAAVNRFGVSDSNVTYLGERVERDPDLIDDRSTKDNVESALLTLAERSGVDDDIFVLLIGHGSYQGEESRFSLPGPDMTPQDFSRALARFPTHRVALVNTTSASGDFIPALSGERRTIVAATRSPFERNETVFGRYFVEAYSDDGADVDHDERVSILEAFQYARRQVSRYYESENRLLTEHAVLDDNGDGEGSSDPDDDGVDGRFAAQAVFDKSRVVESESEPDDPYLVDLYRQQRLAQDSLAALRARREEMERPAYDAELERLLLRLAQIAAEIRERGGGCLL